MEWEKNYNQLLEVLLHLIKQEIILMLLMNNLDIPFFKVLLTKILVSHIIYHKIIN